MFKGENVMSKVIREFRQHCMLTMFVLFSAGAISAQQMVPVAGFSETGAVESMAQWGGIGQIDGLTVSIADVVTEADNQDTTQELTCPSDLAGLTDGWDIMISRISREYALSLNLFGESSLKVDDTVMLAYYVFYKDLRDPETHAIVGRCGAGIALAVHTRSLDASLGFSLPAIAVSASANQSEAEFRLKTIGLSGNGIIAASPSMPMLGRFDAGAYIEALTTIDKVRDAVITAAESEVTVTPVRLTVRYPGGENGALLQQLTGTRALASIAEGVDCRKCLKSLPSQLEHHKEVVVDAYEAIVGTCSKRKPNETAKKKANELLEFVQIPEKGMALEP